jgi:hypothetical protein
VSEVQSVVEQITPTLAALSAEMAANQKQIGKIAQAAAEEAGRSPKCPGAGRSRQSVTISSVCAKLTEC